MYLPAGRNLAVAETTSTAKRLGRNWIFMFWPVEIDTKTYIINTLGHIHLKHCFKDNCDFPLVSLAWDCIIQ